MLNDALHDFSENNKLRLGLVSADIPLISNLDIWGNIALIRQYHNNLQEDEARRMVLQYLHRFDLDHIIGMRNSSLTHEDRFCVMLLRAVMVADAVIVIDRPFQMMPDLKDASFIRDALRKVNDSYRESHIFDYTWNAHRYR
jgi:ABC-type lipoprotein export system ATPase subunit